MLVEAGARKLEPTVIAPSPSTTRDPTVTIAQRGTRRRRAGVAWPAGIPPLKTAANLDVRSSSVEIAIQRAPESRCAGGGRDGQGRLQARRATDDFIVSCKQGKFKSIV